MQFTKRLREGVRKGEITCSVRIWTRPLVKRRGRYKIEGGEIEVDSIERIELSDVTPALARESGFKSVVDLLKIAKHGRGENVYLVRFHFVPTGERKRGTSKRRVPATKTTSPARQRQRVSRIVERLPEGAAIAHGRHLSLEVRNKRFGWFLDDHHGDGRVALNCKASADMHDVLQQLAPAQFHTPKYLGSKGWIGLWLDVPKANWDAVELALREAYTLVAPKALLKRLRPARGSER
ncbi:MAG TPA: hypothetical protein VF193_08375 [Steroidobacter sp.]